MSQSDCEKNTHICLFCLRETKIQWLISKVEAVTFKWSRACRPAIPNYLNGGEEPEICLLVTVTSSKNVWWVMKRQDQSAEDFIFSFDSALNPQLRTLLQRSPRPTCLTNHDGRLPHDAGQETSDASSILFLSSLLCRTVSRGQPTSECVLIEVGCLKRDRRCPCKNVVPSGDCWLDVSWRNLKPSSHILPPTSSMRIRVRSSVWRSRPICLWRYSCETPGHGGSRWAGCFLIGTVLNEAQEVAG